MRPLVNSSTIAIIDTDSALSEPDVALPVGPKAKRSKAVPRSTTLATTTEPRQSLSAKGTPKKDVPRGKDRKAKVTPKKCETGKGKGGAKEGEVKKPRPKAVKKPEIPVEPPVFDKVDTRLGRVEAEQRMAVIRLLGSEASTETEAAEGIPCPLQTCPLDT